MNITTDHDKGQGFSELDMTAEFVRCDKTETANTTGAAGGKAVRRCRLKSEHGGDHQFGGWCVAPMEFDQP